MHQITAIKMAAQPIELLGALIFLALPRRRTTAPRA